MNKQRILIADDDPIFSAIAADNLAGEGYDIVTASDGAAAWGELIDRRFDLAIVDLTMPQIDGFRLIALIRATPDLRDMPIIVVTVRDDEEAMIEASRLGSNAYISKPVNWDRLRQGIRASLQIHGQTTKSTRQRDSSAQPA